MLLRMAACAFAVTISACAAQFSQLPVDQPHGTLRIRVVAKDPTWDYQVDAVLDEQPVVRLRGNAAVRVKPGSHALSLIVEGREYALGTEVTYSRGQGECVGLSCEVRLPKKTEHPALIAEGGMQCSHSLDVHVERGASAVALLVLGPGQRCSACVVRDTRVSHCP